MPRLLANVIEVEEQIGDGTTRSPHRNVLAYYTPEGERIGQSPDPLYPQLHTVEDIVTFPLALEDKRTMIRCLESAGFVFNADLKRRLDDAIARELAQAT